MIKQKIINPSVAVEPDNNDIEMNCNQIDAVKKKYKQARRSVSRLKHIAILQQMLPSINVNKPASKQNVNNNNHEDHTSNTTTSIRINPNPSSNEPPNKSPNAATSNTTNKLNDSPPRRNKPVKRKNNQTDFCCTTSGAIVSEYIWSAKENKGFGNVAYVN